VVYGAPDDNEEHEERNRPCRQTLVTPDIHVDIVSGSTPPLKLNTADLTRP
jgi:hypothetical protein